MLNKNQSKKSNSWKYAMVMPLLFAFMFYYQVKVVAQEKKGAPKEKNAAYAQESAIYIDKNSTGAEMKTVAVMLQKTNSVFIKFSKIKRNSKGEITAIRIDYKDKVGKKGTSIIGGDEPIDSLTIFRRKNSIEITSNDKKNEVYETAIANEEVTDLVEYTNPVSEKMANVEINDNDFPTPPTTPRPNKDIKKAIIIINGNKTKATLEDLNKTDQNLIESMTVLKRINALRKYGKDGENGAIEIITKENVDLLKSSNKKSKLN